MSAGILGACCLFLAVVMLGIYAALAPAASVIGAL